MKKVYIAGKVTGLPIHEVTIKFGAAQKAIEAAGAVPVNPLEVVNDWQCDWKTAMRKCVAALMECDYIYLLPDWQASRGALIEQRIAVDVGIKLLIGSEKHLKERIYGQL